MLKIEKYKEDNFYRSIFYEYALNYKSNMMYYKGLREAIKHNRNLPIKEKRKYLSKIEIKLREMLEKWHTPTS